MFELVRVTGRGQGPIDSEDWFADEERSAERLETLEASNDPAAVKAWRDGLLRKMNGMN